MRNTAGSEPLLAAREMRERGLPYGEYGESEPPPYSREMREWDLPYSGYRRI